jgi:hypothetical protein
MQKIKRRYTTPQTPIGGITIGRVVSDCLAYDIAEPTVVGQEAPGGRVWLTVKLLRDGMRPSEFCNAGGYPFRPIPLENIIATRNLL